MNELGKHPVILFDGVCNLCNASVQYVIKHDPQRIFRFASLQSPRAQKILSGHNPSLSDYSSFVLFTDNKIYIRSTAALMVAKRLNSIAKLLYPLIILPKFIRDTVYNIIAKNRYKWFGKKQACWLPTPELKNLFLDTTI